MLEARWAPTVEREAAMSQGDEGTARSGKPRAVRVGGDFQADISDLRTALDRDFHNTYEAAAALVQPDRS
jgi:hypothetical protein